MFYTIAFIICIIPLLLIFPTKVIGKKNMIKKGKVIFCCNHQSNNDLLIIGTRVPRRMKYMAKESLFKNKFFGKIITWLGAYPVKRGQTDIVALKKTLTYLKNQKAVCIFPEGARLKTKEENELKSGVIIFALKTNSPIVPSCIVKKPKPFTRNVLIIGEPFVLSDLPEFKDIKINDELVKLGCKILHEKMFNLLKEYNKSIELKKAKKQLIK